MKGLEDWKTKKVHFTHIQGDQHLEAMRQTIYRQQTAQVQGEILLTRKPTQKK